MDRSEQDLAEQARGIIDANRYLTLATADGDGRPWATPVWYAHEGYTDFLWLSRPEARHSRNLVRRPEIAIAIFDSTVPPGFGQAVYVEAVADEVTEAERERAVATYSRRSEADGAGQFHGADVIAPAPFRLYRARAQQHFVLGPHDQRILVQLP
jgi:nitroimidazol reductase NimA-like FMN-containing flavoprotein (pyridoxamine 5'-phosphate oxidase superfamily)